MLSIVVGVVSSSAAIILKNSVFYTHRLLQNAFPNTEFNLLYLAFPIIGITLTVLFIRYFVKDDLSHGVTKILYAISRNNGKIKRHHTYSSLITSTMTVGFGGSVGLEAPIALTGSAIGSQLGSLFRLSPKSLILLTACGTSSAVAAIFNAPIAGMLFAIEILMLDMTTAALLPLLVSVVTATSFSYLFLGKDVMFNEIPSDLDYAMQNLIWYIILGILTGFISVYFIRSNEWVSKRFQKIKKPAFKILLGGSILSLLIFVFPTFFGEGYDMLANIMNGKGEVVFNNSPLYKLQFSDITLLLFLIALLLLKPFATAFTNAAGGIGGVFAPSLFVGGITGYILITFCNTFLGLNLSVINFTLAGMAGVMGSIMNAPLMAIFLIAEISGGYQLLIPLILCAVSSYILFYSFEKYSVYTKPLAQQGDLITHDKNKQALNQLKVSDFIENDFQCVLPDATLLDLTKVIEKSKRNIFPMVDKAGIFYGLVILDDVRQLIFHPENLNHPVDEYAFVPKESIHPEESMFSVVRKFETSGNYNIPVIDESGKYHGFISRANVYTKYREYIEEISED
ncbi:MAG: chloride channel protein [Bacteroidales bacterium]|nr:chloride channel protein [Bacteroidales bacterium]